MANGSVSGLFQRDGRQGWWWKINSKDPTTGRYKQIRRHCLGSEADAKKARLLDEVKVVNGKFQPPDKTTVAVMMDAWLEHKIDGTERKKIEPKTWQGYESLIRYHINGIKTNDAAVSRAFAKLRVQDVTAVHVQRLYKELRDERVEDGVLLNIHRMLHGFFESTLIPFGPREHNPVVKTLAPSPKRAKKKALSGSELIRLRQTLLTWKGGKYYAFFMTYAATGTRRGEVLALTWANINKLGLELTVERSVGEVSQKTADKFGIDRLYFKAPKSKTGNRGIAFAPNYVRFVLDPYRLERTKLGLGKETDLVFCHDDGRKFAPVWATQLWNKFAAENGFDITLHELRHTYGSQLVANLTDFASIKELMGHADISTTLNNYGHALPANKQKAAKQIGDLLFGKK